MPSGHVHDFSWDFQAARCSCGEYAAFACLQALTEGQAQDDAADPVREEVARLLYDTEPRGLGMESPYEQVCTSYLEQADSLLALLRARGWGSK